MQACVDEIRINLIPIQTGIMHDTIQQHQRRATSQRGSLRRRWILCQQLVHQLKGLDRLIRQIGLLLPPERRSLLLCLRNAQ